MAIRKPGKKIRLPPRVPAFIAKLPRIGEETERSKEKRAAARISGQLEPKRELRHTEFATTEVVRTIEKARALSQGNEIAPSREESLDEIMILGKGAERVPTWISKYARSSRSAGTMSNFRGCIASHRSG